MTEEELTSKLLELLEPTAVGAHFQTEGSKALLYTVVPREGMPACVVGAAAHWLYHILGGTGSLARLVALLSQAVSKWLTERSEGIPIVA